MDRIEGLLDELCVEQATMALAKEREILLAFNIARADRDALRRQIADGWGEMVKALAATRDDLATAQSWLQDYVVPKDLLTQDRRALELHRESAAESLCLAQTILSRAKGES